MTQLIIIIRDGLSHNNTLTKHGECQMYDLAQKLVKILGKKPIIITSTAKRALMSSEIMTIISPEIPIEKSDVLCPKYNTSIQLSAIHDLVQNKIKNEYSTLILVTHERYTDTFPKYLYQKLFSENAAQFSTLKNGEAYVIDSNPNSFYYKLKDLLARLEK